MRVISSAAKDPTAGRKCNQKTRPGKIMAGYSETPLVKKLGIKPGTRVALLGAPANYRATLGALPEGVRLSSRLNGKFDLVQLFAKAESGLRQHFAAAAKTIPPQGVIWISWPKRASGLKTDLDENKVRAFGLALGLVDVKVCAVDEIWSGLKFVYRLKDR